MATAPDLTKLVPGFDFLQGLVKNAGSALPSVGQWIAPTIDPDEISKRIEELKTVQFWLEQNARMLSATIQAMEVQRMTLSTLKTMNVQMGDLTEVMKLRVPGLTPDAPPARAAAAPAPTPTPAPPADEPAPKAKAAKGHDKGNGAPAGLVDPMQWWNALTQQFTQLATAAVEGAEAMSANVARTASAVPGATAKPAAARPAAAKKPAAKKAARRPAARKSSS